MYVPFWGLWHYTKYATSKVYNIHPNNAAMNKSFLTIIFICLISGLYAQTSMSLKIKYADTIITGKYEPDLNNGFKYKEIEVEPGEYRILNPAIPRILNDETITQVDL